MGLSIFIHWKRDSYNLIFIIVDEPIKIVYYKLIKVTINMSSLSKVIIDVMVRYYSLLNSIVINQMSLFILKF